MYLANVLEHRDRLLKVSDVEDGQDELDVGVVTNAVGHLLVTCLAVGRLVAHSLLRARSKDGGEKSGEEGSKESG